MKGKKEIASPARLTIPYQFRLQWIYLLGLHEIRGVSPFPNNSSGDL